MDELKIKWQDSLTLWPPHICQGAISILVTPKKDEVGFAFVSDLLHYYQSRYRNAGIVYIEERFDGVIINLTHEGEIKSEQELKPLI